MARKEKLSPIPRRPPPVPMSTTVSSDASATAPAGPVLDHIAEDLRPLARPIGELAFMVGNPLSHPEDQIENLKASLKEFGQVEPFIVNRRATPPVVIGGNGRLQAALSLGWTHVAAVYVDLPQERANALAVLLNRTREGASWDKAALDKILREVDVGKDPRLDAMLKELGQKMGVAGHDAGETDPDDIPAPPDEARTRPGDIWILGKHRLLCGDSSKAEDVDRLLAGATIQLVNTDPPYNVKVEPRSNNAIAAGLSSFEGTKHHQALDLARHPGKAKPTGKKMRAKDRPLANDFMSDDAFDEMLAAWFGNLARVLEPGCGFYIWGGYANCANYPPVLKACELYFSQAVIWVKEHPVLTRKDFMGNHEWCFYGWREGAAHRWFGPTNAVDVWSIKKVNPQSMIHLTEKPVELAVRAIDYSSRAGENVLDLFGGSGSTLIACEQTGRNAFLMELDPPYCDLIVERWEKFTGQKATLA